MKICPFCLKGVEDDTIVCTCGYDFGLKKPKEPKKTNIVKQAKKTKKLSIIKQNIAKIKGTMPGISLFSFTISAVCIIMGFFKMLVYKKADRIANSINTYVGGDAYNYIINSNYAIAYFVLAGVFVLLGGFFMLGNYIKSLKQ